MRPPSYRRWSMPFLAVALLMAASAPAQAAESDRVAGGAQSSRLIPVWAFVHGEAPVANARVSVTAAGKPVRQVGGRMWKRTNAEGVVLLHMRRVPRRFTVVVRGGRAAGMHVRGDQRRAVAQYRDARLIEVNPLTTLVTRLRRQRPRLDNRRAVRAVKRYFHVPQWADLGQNLRDLGDEWFDARAYVRNVRRHGSVDRLNRRLARKILSGKAPRARKARRAPTATASQGKGWLQMTPGELAGAGFGYLGANFAGIITQGGITAALGALLQLAQGAGLINLPPSEMDLVRQQLDALGVQVSRLEGRVKNLTKGVAFGRASELFHMSDNVLAFIDSAKKRLAHLANLDQDREKELRKAYAAEIDQYIHDKLLDAPEILNRHLNPSLSIGDNVIKATSRALATERFFDMRDSAEVQAVYDYFALYQLHLTVLLTNYWNAHPDTYSAATIKASIADIQANVLATQKQSLKPPVPTGTFFDTETPRFMWGTQNETVNALRLEEEQLAKKTTLVMGPFRNWQMAADGDFRNLLEGASGQPRQWLQDQITVPIRHQLLWASDSLHRRPVGNGDYELLVTIFDLATGRDERHAYGNSHAAESWCDIGRRCGLQNPRLRDFLSQKTGGLMLLRYLASGESYWW